ncbi:MAG: pilus assembly protein [Heliobacteriaceae bacterium]|nr:pilus assembly protein [Heliobacteriaceae bacterium]MDD4588304.1 pilus assembly protein [Heliobacteriaceae bacterium]
MWLRSLFPSQRGQALVELAIALPVLVLLVLGTIEFGRVFYAYQVVTNASREGARLAAIGEGDVTVFNRVKSAGSVLSPPLADGHIGVAPAGTRQRGAAVTVTVSYPVAISVPFFATTTYTVKGSTAMMVE